MKHLHLISLLTLTYVPVCLAQGDLAPPAGAPAPTMKSLDEIWDKIPVAENRIPISSLPFTIGASGIYYLTKNLDFTDGTGDAIVIGANNVTLDLNGFRISSGLFATGDAIHSIGAATRLQIMNGRIQGGATVTFNAGSWSKTSSGFNNGISVSGSNYCVFTDLVFTGCQNNGIAMGGNSVLRNVLSSSNGINGIISNGSDNDFSHCVCSYDFNYGIYSSNSILSACLASYNGGAGLSSTGGAISNCLARYNKYDGIVATGGVLSFSIASNNNQVGLTYLDINAAGATRTGNLPTP